MFGGSGSKVAQCCLYSVGIVATCFLLAPAGTARAEQLYVQFNSCVNGIQLEQATSGTLAENVSCQPFESAGGSAVSGTVSAAFGTLGSTLTLTGGGTSESGGSPAVNAGSSFTDTLHIGGVPAGTPVALTFVIPFSGTWAYSLPSYVDGFESFSINAYISGINGEEGDILNQGQGLIFCSPNTIHPVADSCNTNAFSASGELSGIFYSSIVNTTAGATLNPYIQFYNAIGGVYWLGSVTSDFLDPATLAFVATNPVTGAPLSGITITGDSGTIYSVNEVLAAPEPSTLTLSLSVLIVLIASRITFRRLSKT